MKELINHFLRAGFELKASDIHLTVGVPPTMRINGELKKYGKNTLKPDDIEGMAREIIPENMWDKFKEKGELDFSYGLPGVSRFRVNAYLQRSSVALAIRVIPSMIPTLEELCMPDVIKNAKAAGVGTGNRTYRKWEVDYFGFDDSIHERNDAKTYYYVRGSD